MSSSGYVKRGSILDHNECYGDINFNMESRLFCFCEGLMLIMFVLLPSYYGWTDLFQDESEILFNDVPSCNARNFMLNRFIRLAEREADEN